MGKVCGDCLDFKKSYLAEYGYCEARLAVTGIGANRRAFLIHCSHPCWKDKGQPGPRPFQGGGQNHD